MMKFLSVLEDIRRYLRQYNLSRDAAVLVVNPSAEIFFQTTADDWFSSYNFLKLIQIQTLMNIFTIWRSDEEKFMLESSELILDLEPRESKRTMCVGGG